MELFAQLSCNRILQQACLHCYSDRKAPGRAQSQLAQGSPLKTQQVELAGRLLESNCALKTSANSLGGGAGRPTRHDRWKRGKFSESTKKFRSIRANDSSQHDTADCSDATSENKETGTHLDKRPFETQSGMAEIRAQSSGDNRGSSVESAGPSLEVGSQGLIFGVGEVDAWDSGMVGAPVVRRYLSDNEERWLMWYRGSAGGQQGTEEAQTGEIPKNSIGLAVSSNGIHWRRGNGFVDSNEHGSEGVGKVLECSTNWWAFDTESICPSDVLVMSSLKVRAAAGVYWLYYEGGSAENVELPQNMDLPVNLQGLTYHDGQISTLRTRPGLAMSHDGRNWARIEGDHHSGSLFDVGNEGEWDSLFIAAPHVVFHNADDIRMYYHSFDCKSGCFTMGLARSRDGMRWVKLGKILGGGLPGAFDELGVKSAQVVPEPDGKGYLMIYEAVSRDGGSSFGLARSSDGLLHWERCSDKPIFFPAAVKNAWDSGGVQSPCLVHLDGLEWRLYYQGFDSQGKTGIGVAVCQDGSLQEFQRFQGLHL